MRSLACFYHVSVAEVWGILFYNIIYLTFWNSEKMTLFLKIISFGEVPFLFWSQRFIGTSIYDLSIHYSILYCWSDDSQPFKDRMSSPVVRKRGSSPSQWEDNCNHFSWSTHWGPLPASLVNPKRWIQSHNHNAILHEKNLDIWLDFFAFLAAGWQPGAIPLDSHGYTCQVRINTLDVHILTRVCNLSFEITT